MRSLQVLPRSTHILGDSKHAVLWEWFEKNKQRNFLLEKGGTRRELSSSISLENEIYLVQLSTDLFIDSSLLGDSSLCNWNQDTLFIEANEGLPISEIKLIKIHKGKDQRKRATVIKQWLTKRFKNLIAKEDF